MPVLILDVTEEEADKLLATVDPLAAMAETDDVMLKSLLDEIDDQQINEMLGEPELPSDGKQRLTPMYLDRPPELSWALIAIPTVRWPEISEMIERIAGVDGTIVNTTVTSNES